MASREHVLRRLLRVEALLAVVRPQEAAEPPGTCELLEDGSGILTIHERGGPGEVAREVRLRISVNQPVAFEDLPQVFQDLERAGTRGPS